MFFNYLIGGVVHVGDHVVAVLVVGDKGPELDILQHQLFNPGSERNNIINAPEISVTLNSLMPPILLLSEISTGAEPIISMMANKVNVTVRSSLILMSIREFYQS